MKQKNIKNGNKKVEGIEGRFSQVLNEPRNNFELKKNVESKLILGKRLKKRYYISIVIPTFLRVETLKYAISSVLEQDISDDVEIIVVDNSANCTEENETYKYLKSLNIENILYYQNQENIGIFGNWNRCIELAQGKYISFLHDDDMLGNGYLKTIRNYLKNLDRKKVKLGAIKVSYLEVMGNRKAPQIKNIKRGLVNVTLFQCLLRGITPTSCPTCGMIFNRNSIINIGGFDERFYSSDYLIGYFMLKEGYKIYCTREKLAYYRYYINDSLSIDTRIKFVNCDYWFREHMYKQNMFTKLFGKIFRNTQYKKSIDSFLESSKKLHVPIKKRDLDFLNQYQENFFIEKIFDAYIKMYEILLHERIPF